MSESQRKFKKFQDHLASLRLSDYGNQVTFLSSMANVTSIILLIKLSDPHIVSCGLEEFRIEHILHLSQLVLLLAINPNTQF